MALSMLLLALAPAWANTAAPDNLADLIQQFNLENGISEPESETVEDDYGLATYDKSKTQFDGVTNEMQVSYLKLTLD